MLLCVNIETINTPRGIKTIYNFKQNRNFLQISYMPIYDIKSEQILYQKNVKARNLITGETKQYTSKMLIVNIPVYELNNNYPLIINNYTKLLGFKQVLTEQKQNKQNGNNDNNNSKYIHIGITDEITACECCGKTNLKKTAILQNIDNGEFKFVGSECKNKYNIN